MASRPTTTRVGVPEAARALKNVEGFSPEQWREQYRLLRARLQNADELIAELGMRESAILELKSKIGGSGDMGSTPGGVFLVRTASGLKALKIVANDWNERVDISQGATNLRRDEVVVQNQLAGYGLSVPITGVLGTDEVRKLLVRFPELKDLMKHYADYAGASWTAHLSDYVPGAYNPKKWGATNQISDLPPDISNWHMDDLRRQANQIALARDMLNIHLLDPQIMIDHEGRVVAIDLAQETVLDRDDRDGANFHPPDYVTPTHNQLLEIIRMIEEKAKRLVA